MTTKISVVQILQTRLTIIGITWRTRHFTYFVQFYIHCFSTTLYSTSLDPEIIINILHYSVWNTRYRDVMPRAKSSGRWTSEHSQAPRIKIPQALIVQSKGDIRHRWWLNYSIKITMDSQTYADTMTPRITLVLPGILGRAQLVRWNGTRYIAEWSETL